ncbi:hypothetical protein PV458_16995 [Streptomyces sp. MN03-5084-2B]|nr:hypothetical protein [Streptomyces sp. MN03-5084-2B]
MTFLRRAARSAAVAAGIALTMAMALGSPAEANPNGGARFDGGRAAAAPAQPAGTSPTVRIAPIPDDGRVNCFNYVGTFKQDTGVWVVGWQGGSTYECFGIAPDRTIWHAWPGSGGWKPMPGNGRADFVFDAWDNTAGDRRITVYVTAISTPYCQNYSRSGGWTGHWYPCTP